MDMDGPWTRWTLLVGVGPHIAATGMVSISMDQRPWSLVESVHEQTEDDMRERVVCDCIKKYSAIGLL